MNANYVEKKSESGITMECPNFGPLLKEKAIAKANGYIFKSLQASDFKSKDAFTDYKEAVDCLRVVVANRGEGNVSNCQLVLGRLGIDTAFADKLFFTAKNFKGNRVDYTTEWGAILKDKQEELKAWNEGEIRLPKMDKETGLQSVDKDGNPATRKPTAKETSEAVDRLSKECKEIRETKPVYFANIFFALSESAFRLQFEEVVGAYLAGTKIEDVEVKSCFQRIKKNVQKYGLTMDVEKYAMADDYKGCKTEYDKLKAAYDKAEEERKAAEVLMGEIEK
jgi:hypothetical protein